MLLPMTAASETRTETDDQLDAVVQASRVLVAIVARSLAEVDGTVSVLQFRALVILADTSQRNLKDVADQLGVHPSNATRLVDKLVTLKLVTRKEAQPDRRYITLALTAKGKRLVDQVMAHRRAAIRQIITTMPPAQRRTLTVSLQAFSEAAVVASVPTAEYVLQLPT